MSEDTRTNAERWGGQCSECKVYGGGHRWECSQDAPYRERYADALRCAGHAEADVRRWAGLDAELSEAEEGSIEGGVLGGVFTDAARHVPTLSDLDSQLATIDDHMAEFCETADEQADGHTQQDAA